MFLEGGWEDSLMPILAQVVKLDFKFVDYIIVKFVDIKDVKDQGL